MDKNKTRWYFCILTLNVCQVKEREWKKHELAFVIFLFHCSTSTPRVRLLLQFIYRFAWRRYHSRWISIVYRCYCLQISNCNLDPGLPFPMEWVPLLRQLDENRRLGSGLVPVIFRAVSELNEILDSNRTISVGSLGWDFGEFGWFWPGTTRSMDFMPFWECSKKVRDWPDSDLWWKPTQ